MRVDDVYSLRAALISLFNRNLRTGMAHEAINDVRPPAHFREAQRFDAAAELALFAAIGCCSSAIIKMSPLHDCQPAVMIRQIELEVAVHAG